jgi:hypothetical protein
MERKGVGKVRSSWGGKGGTGGAHREGKKMVVAASVSRRWGRLRWSPAGSVRSCSAVAPRWRWG